MISKFEDYLYDKFMSYDVVDPIVKIGEKVYIYVDSKETVLDEYMQLILDSTEEGFAEQYADHNPEYVFEWGDRYYSRPCIKWNEPIFDPFVNKGSAEGDINIDYINLGVHGRYELMSGTRDYDDWCAKAKFFGQDALGICEKNTLAGTLSFQMACSRAGIQPIIGETVRIESEGGKDYLLKFYVRDQKGWKNLLKINTIVNIERSGSMYEEDFVGKDIGEGLICVMQPSKYSTKCTMAKLKRVFDQVYFQIDMSEFEYEAKERESLESLKYWYDNMMEDVQPILINDTYYLEKEDARIKKELMKSGVKGEFHSTNQHYKHIQELFLEWEELWTSDSRSDMIGIFKRATRNTLRLAASCDFEINTSEIHLPKYYMTEGEQKLYNDNEEMIDTLIEEGVERLIDPDKYNMDDVWDRISYEMSVIRKGGFVNYFLITRDIVNWSNDNGIITGIGRGSAAGCLVSYLLGIVLLNPLDYGLLFERFLNESRLKGSMPDIDIDFPGNRRDEVKRYMEERFGGNHVASVGTYVTLQLKAAFQEMGRAMNVSTAGNRIYLSKMLDDCKTWSDLFIAASERPQIKNLVREHGDFINNIQLCLNSPKSQGVHACATIIVPRRDREGNETNIFDYVPMRQTSDGMLVTEWEGPQMESAGFLKEDILGLIQLDKFAMMFDLVKQYDGTDLASKWATQSIPFDDEKTYEAFHKGHTSDVFQFSGDGMTKMLKKLMPMSIEDLTAANALYRPGPMDYIPSYIKRKNGEESIEYDLPLMKDHLSNTYGVTVYQEQVMSLSQAIGGFDKSEADNLRKAMGKKKRDVLDKMKRTFIEGGNDNGHDPDTLEKIWRDWEAFAQYAFNKSHAAAYATTAYWCQWMKVNYPIQFWTTSLTYAKDDKIPPFIGEIMQQGTIQIMPPDINSSYDKFTTDMGESKIFWSLSKISHLGEAAVQNIIKDREEEGKYFELSEFVTRTGANKTVVNNLILAGAFDEMHDITDIKDRLKILKEFNKSRWGTSKSKVTQAEKDAFKDEYDSPDARHEWFWYLRQKKVSGMAYLSSFQKVMRLNTTPETFGMHTTLVDGVGFHSEDAIGKNLLVGGYVVEVEERKTKKGDFYARVLLDCNYIPIRVTIWSDSYIGAGMKHKLKDAKGKLMFFNGKVGGPDRFNDSNTITSVGEGFKGGNGGKLSKMDIVG